MTNTTTTTPTEYLSVTETAKLIRAALRKAFPGVKFGVRSDRYAGGASIAVRWADGPTAAAVDDVVGAYAGGRFDGMIDLAYSVTSWVEADGTAHLAENRGTAENRGSHPSALEAPRTEGARLVHFGADYVHAYRTISAEFAAECAHLAEHNGTVSSPMSCDRCGTWMSAGSTCWTIAHNDARIAGSRIRFVCSPECAGHLAAKHTAR